MGSISAPTSACSASWYRCGAKGRVSAGPALCGEPGVPVCPGPGGRTPGPRSTAGPAPRPCRYLQHFAVHDGADGAGAEAGGEAFKESCSPVHLYDVLGWG